MYNRDENIEKIFNIDSLSKKRVARGASARASRKKGFKGQIKFPSDYLSAKEKKKLSGKVFSYKIEEEDMKKYLNKENLPSFDELLESGEEGKKILEFLRRNFKQKEIVLMFDTTISKMSRAYKKLGVTTRAYKVSKDNKEVSLSSDNTITAEIKDNMIKEEDKNKPVLPETWNEALDLELKEFAGLFNYYGVRILSEKWGVSIKDIAKNFKQLKKFGTSVAKIKRREEIMNNNNDVIERLEGEELKDSLKEKIQSSILQSPKRKECKNLNFLGIKGKELTAEEKEMINSREEFKEQIETSVIKEEPKEIIKDKNINKDYAGLNINLNVDDANIDSVKLLMNNVYCILKEDSRYNFMIEIKEK